MKTIAAAIGAAWLLIACSPKTPTYQVIVSPDLGETGTLSIREAASSWERMAPGATFVVSVARTDAFATDDHANWPENTIYVVPGSPVPGSDDQWSGKTFHNPSSNASLVKINPDYVSYVDVAEHELGHAMGLAHSESDAIMRPFDPWHESPTITCSDSEAYWDTWHPGEPFKCPTPGSE